MWPNPSIERTHNRLRRLRSAHVKRVCQAWHRTSEVKVLVPGDRGAEGEEKGQGAHHEVGSGGSPNPHARGDEQEPERRCGTPGTSGHVTAKSSIRRGGGLYQSGVYARNVLCRTLGDLPVVP